ncbi:MAG: Hsp20/alpha crystallin family protein [Candidatus Marinimicrobia bacterium]|nr:Hsp20/alpha crystallin family protein [Candidatus Neomarinimicrobiota bacterium]
MMLVKRNYSSPSVEHYYNNLFDNFLGGSLLDSEACESVDWSPRMEVEESENAFFLNVEVPGMKKKDIDISIKESVITISGEKKAKEHKNESAYYLNEVRYGKFSRSFKLPGNVDIDKIKGSWNEGVLTVEVPKTEIAKPRKIEIN